ncbi:exodeoxyribonuclease V subunit gamma, partial [Mycolicibacterium insubricum]
MAFHLHRAERTDLLAQGLGELLATPPDDPFGMDLVLVPARGVERWLSQRLSHLLGATRGNDGVCAAVQFRSPGSLIAELTGADDHDPWSPDALTWPLLRVIDDALAADAGQPWCAALAAHLGATAEGEEAELRRGRRYAVARRIAGLFASYGYQRPALLADWAAGRDTDGAGDPLPKDLSWQPILWRRLVDQVRASPPDERHRDTVTRLRAGALDLPQRLSLFGHTRLSATDIELLDALAVHHELHLWLPHPSDVLWQHLADDKETVRRRTDTSHRSVGHPLLATLGRDLRELQRALPAGIDDDHRELADRPDTLLSWLQSDLAADAVRPQGRTHRSEDRSVQVHSCHGPARQIEALREV